MSDLPRKGILLAGGRGTRLYPLTASVSKQLTAVFDKPMIYYPLTTLMLAGITDILVISDPGDVDGYRNLLADGSSLGIAISYAEQPEPNGIAEALIIGEDFVGDAQVILMLGDNLLYGRYDFLRLAIADEGRHATIFAYHVDDPTAYGVIEIAHDGSVLSIEEKPARPRSHWAVPGLYVYPTGIAEEARSLTPSARGELEITDLHRRLLTQGRLKARKMGRGTAWFDTGTAQELLEAANFIEAIQRRQGLLIGCPEEVAFRRGLINDDQLMARIHETPASPYRTYLERVMADEM